MGALVSALVDQATLRVVHGFRADRRHATAELVAADVARRGVGADRDWRVHSARRTWPGCCLPMLHRAHDWRGVFGCRDRRADGRRGAAARNYGPTARRAVDCDLRGDDSHWLSWRILERAPPAAAWLPDRRIDHARELRRGVGCRPRTAADCGWRTIVARPRRELQERASCFAEGRRPTRAFWPSARSSSCGTSIRFRARVLYMHMVEHMGFSEQFSGNMVSVQATGAIMASVAYTAYCRRLSVTQLVCLSIVMGVLATIGYWALADDRSAHRHQLRRRLRLHDGHDRPARSGCAGVRNRNGRDDVRAVDVAREFRGRAFPHRWGATSTIGWRTASTTRTRSTGWWGLARSSRAAVSCWCRRFGGIADADEPKWK